MADRSAWELEPENPACTSGPTRWGCRPDRTRHCGTAYHRSQRAREQVSSPWDRASGMPSCVRANLPRDLARSRRPIWPEGRRHIHALGCAAAIEIASHDEHHARIARRAAIRFCPCEPRAGGRIRTARGPGGRACDCRRLRSEPESTMAAAGGGAQARTDGSDLSLAPGPGRTRPETGRREPTAFGLSCNFARVFGSCVPALSS